MDMKESPFVLGIDFGTDSVRTIMVNAANGEEIASAVHHYSRWQEGRFCLPEKNQFRQHPLDYLEGLEITLQRVLKDVSQDVSPHIKGISIDTTGSTPVAVDRKGTPLSMTPGFEENPNAMFVLWKDHTAVAEAAEINHLAHAWEGEDYTKYVGGVYSSEWFWAKILHILREDPQVREAAFSWVEHCDWMPALLTGTQAPRKMKRSRCAAGHKAMWHAEFGGLPSEEFLAKVDPLLSRLRDRLYTDTYTCDIPVGTLTPEWARRFGLSKNVVVGVGAFDAHLGAVGGEITPYVLSKVIGTSTCDMLVAPLKEMQGKLVKGICGQVDGSILPGMLGMEAGQSAFGDIYAWFKDLLMWPIETILPEAESIGKSPRTKLQEEIAEKLIPKLSQAAAAVTLDESSIIALDWMNGRRTPFANQLLKGAISGLNLASDAPRVFRALVEATAFGARKIVDRFQDEGIPITGVIALGGIPKKAPFIMQVLCNVLNMPIKVARSEQAVALGSAMAAATAAGIYPSLEEAQKAMGNGVETEYRPQPAPARKYQQLYEKYSQLGTFVENQMT
jgi:L-ribulokinase